MKKFAKIKNISVQHKNQREIPQFGKLRAELLIKKEILQIFVHVHISRATKINFMILSSEYLNLIVKWIQIKYDKAKAHFNYRLDWLSILNLQLYREDMP